MIDTKLRAVIEENLSVILNYDPYKKFKGIKTTADFSELLRNDPAFAPFFLYQPKYITARIGGNLITSLHRKLGDLYEELFKVLLKEKLNVPESDLEYAVEIRINGETQQRSTDGLIRFGDYSGANQTRLSQLAKIEGVVGMAFEVRSCYQIGDSKRIQADRDLAVSLKRNQIEPIMLIFCVTSLSSPVRRLSNYWNIYEGENAFDFVYELTQFDLYEFLRQEGETIKNLMDSIFEMM